MTEQRQRAEGKWQRAEGRGQRAEGRGQRAEGRGQRAEGRGQRAEGRGQRAEATDIEVITSDGVAELVPQPACCLQVPQTAHADESGDDFLRRNHEHSVDPLLGRCLAGTHTQ